MSECIVIKSYRHKYSVYFVNSYLEALEQNVNEGDYILVDKHVYELYEDLMQFAKNHRKMIIEPSEKAKSYEALTPIIDELIRNRFTKKNRLIAVGGGITQDVTAFSASILFRGVDWLFFPTNLLTQCDSCIGSKTSINFGPFKNQLGGFSPPKNIFIDLRFLDTLPLDDLRSGLGEMLHYFLVSGDEDFQRFEKDIDRVLEDREVLRGLILRSLNIKKAMVELDEFDQGPRNVFNYGHSFGHALESSTDYRLSHGIAVSFGMDIANIISADRGLISMNLRNRIRPTLAKIWKDKSVDNLDVHRFFEALLRDKKNEGNEIKVILTQGLGNMFKTTFKPKSDMRRIENYFVNKLYERDI